MGLREDAEKLVSEDRRRVEEYKRKFIAETRARVPDSVKKWSTGIGPEEDPVYTTRDGPYTPSDGWNGTQMVYNIDLTLEGIHFRGQAIFSSAGGSNSCRLEMKIVKRDGSVGHPISTPRDIAYALSTGDFS
ncbi:hypothetical protein ACQCSX_21985 (plasmid) [Pseudarthrobacter sp. P1]|uniref:hypothetical protein n=1 Tax=Pseudarthrobacter sp. P1 TaxID=3418418 RepID=UPI003CEAF87C